MSSIYTAPAYLEAGTNEYKQANLAMFLGGFATFSLLYGPQTLLPLFAQTFHVSPAGASLTLSAGTAALALMLIPFSLLSDRYGRSLLMKCSLFGSAFFTLLVPLVDSFSHFLVLRVLLGIAIAGLPATAMAYLGEEIAPSARGRAMGLYIAGNAFGGMSGRFIISWLTSMGGWHMAFLCSGLLGMAAAILFYRSVPDSRHFRARAVSLSVLWQDARALFADAALPKIYAVSFMLMGVFVALYNYLGFRLEASPYGLSHTQVSAIFLLYALGTLSSATAGRWVDKIGRRNVLWRMVVLMIAGLALTQFAWLPLIVAGVALFTMGFFGTHSTASGWAGERARERRALSSAVYLTAYYLGGSLLGSGAGLAWGFGQWRGVSATLLLALLAVLGCALLLKKITPLSSTMPLSR
ncbi:MAG TPA: MFS transporter [Limnobacter sp.]|uniref:MFS transporter n=1 Tax=Limnobacter sp. TaxID=2003368 RepID=UPI002ED8265C